RRYSQTEKGQKCFRKDRAWNSQCQQHQNSPNDIGQKVTKNNFAKLGSANNSRLDQLHLPQTQDFTANVPLTTELRKRYQGDQQSSPPATHHNLQQDNHDQFRNGGDDVGDSHHQVVDKAAKIARYTSVDDPNQYIYERRTKADK